MSTFFISDIHFGHQNIVKYDHRPFNSLEEMDETIIFNWNAKVKPEDTVYILGDVSWYNAAKTAEILKRLNGHKVLIKGNHDKVCTSPLVRDCFDEITQYKEIVLDKKAIILFHYPIAAWNGQYRGSYHLYGHVHKTQDYDNYLAFKEMCKKKGIPFNAYNVGFTCLNNVPCTFEEIISD